MIGVAGATVAPELLFTVGISGSIQFMAGVMKSRHLIAVCDNLNSQIFRYAEKAVCEDAERLLDAMLALLEEDGKESAL